MEQIAIRMLQHFLYCKHRWGLMEIDRAWAENAFIVKGNIVHERAHQKGGYALRGKKVYTDLDIWNDAYGIYGKLDCLEVGKGGYTIVEYKPTQPTDGRFYRTEDALQVYAQKKCVDAMFGCESTGAIYYANTRKRMEISFEGASFEELLTNALREMRACIQQGRIPPIPEKQVCRGCSMKDLCIPAVRRNVGGLRNRIEKALEANE